VSSQRVLEEIEELTNPKVKAGKKALSPEQNQLKAIINFFDTVFDRHASHARSVKLVVSGHERC
jgi:topoisomerase-4 subunit A